MDSNLQAQYITVKNQTDELLSQIKILFNSFSQKEVVQSFYPQDYCVRQIAINIPFDKLQLPETEINQIRNLLTQYNSLRKQEAQIYKELQVEQETIKQQLQQDTKGY